MAIFKTFIKELKTFVNLGLQYRPNPAPHTVLKRLVIILVNGLRLGFLYN